MGKNYVICIGREYGSGGREIGQRLAKELGIAFYDKSLLKKAAQDSGISREYFEKVDEKPVNWFLSNFGSGDPTVEIANPYAIDYDYLTSDRLFLIQSQVIRKLAKEQSCVIIGRCAEYVLADYPNMFSVFVHADMESRIHRIMERQNVDRKQAEALIKKTDKKRASYHNYFCESKWGRTSSYQLSVSSSRFGLEGTVQLIKDVVEKFNQ